MARATMGEMLDRRAQDRGSNPYSIALQQGMGDAQQVYQQRRLPMQQARMDALGQSLSNFQPLNAAIGRMYGDQAAGFNMSPYSPIAPNAGTVHNSPAFQSPEGMTSMGTPEQLEVVAEQRYSPDDLNKDGKVGAKEKRQARRARRRRRRQERRERRRDR